MSRGWSYKLKLLLLPLVALFTMGGVCDWFWGSPGDVTEQPPDGRTIFFPEYDYMEGYDVFQYGQTYAINAFDPCNTDFWAFYDEVITPVRQIRWDSIGWYVVNQWSRTTGGSNPSFDYKAYMCAIKDAYDRPPGESGTLAYTVDGGAEGYTWSVIFVQAITDRFPGDQGAIEHTTIHEMGHMRADLTHLCYTLDSVIWLMSPDHDDSSCVMGEEKISRCTNKDLSINPHFCPACCGRIMHVQW